ncbi:hypothetical protein HNY73_006134 [Argiope bruennichi]|uniref:Uncharacterized protein n=1 Tax=Argiope bruennichi TaxID=94029 RepID=A0A8T0FLY3_ARGBR|nr:hypothetical protein HNY73_006134 [Argiope bruennichi]
MEKVIKRNFIRFAHRVEPIQSVFLEEGCEAENDVLQCFSELQMELVEDMISSACAFSKQRKSESVDPEDLLSYLGAYWNLEPLLVSDGFYRVEERTDALGSTERFQALSSHQIILTAKASRSAYHLSCSYLIFFHEYLVKHTSL